jgi:hypothetical protein
MTVTTVRSRRSLGISVSVGRSLCDQGRRAGAVVRARTRAGLRRGRVLHARRRSSRDSADFLPAHRDQLARTGQLIADAKADGRQRLVEMNEPIRLDLIRIVEGLEALEDGDGR